MGSPDRIETSRMECRCGKGEFVFYQCEPDGWSFRNRPEDIWYEMHIFCDECVNLFQKYNPSKMMITGEPERWKVRIPIPDKVPDL